MKVFKIDVQRQEIYAMHIADGLDPIYSAIGNNCNVFCCPYVLENLDTFYMDDEALCYGQDHIKGGFTVDGNLYVNNALVIGTDQEGASIDAKSSQDDLKKRIKFYTTLEIFAASEESKL